jgi:hypothetical protein
MTNMVRRFSRLLVRSVLVLLALAVIAVAALMVVDGQACKTDEVRIVEVPFMKPGRTR